MTKVKGVWKIQMTGAEAGGEPMELKKTVHIGFEVEDEVYFPYDASNLAEMIAKKLGIDCRVEATFVGEYVVKGGETEDE